MGLSLDGKTGIVLGVANKRSIAWAIAQALAGAGMRLAFTYQGERLRENVEELASTLPDSVLYPCDVSVDDEIAAVFAGLERDLGRLDALVHSIAFARKEDLEGQFLDTAREGFRVAHDVSAYSLVALTRAAASLMERGGGGSVIAMTYYGAEKVAAGYNVMGVAKASLEASVRYLAADLGPRGIRVNAISAGPVNTLAARGIRGFTGMLKHHAERAPLRRNVELREVGDTALFLASPMSSGITGEVIHVDCGYFVMGV
jgi:enoyl-[acyl-carrier protein] reductase I